MSLPSETVADMEEFIASRLLVNVEPGGTMPRRAHDTDAGLDLWPLEHEPLSLAAGQILAVRTGVHVMIPAGHYGQIAGRSSLALKGIAILGGVIDSSYRGEIKVVMVNHSRHRWAAEPGKAIAQLIVHKIALPEPVLWGPEQMIATSRGANGFGSTDSSRGPAVRSFLGGQPGGQP